VNNYIKKLLDSQEYNKLVGDHVKKICYLTRNMQKLYKITTITRKNMKMRIIKYKIVSNMKKRKKNEYKKKKCLVILHKNDYCGMKHKQKEYNYEVIKYYIIV